MKKSHYSINYSLRLPAGFLEGIEATVHERGDG